MPKMPMMSSRMLLVLLIFPWLAGCDLVSRFDSPEDRVNAAVPVDPVTLASWQHLQSQISEQADIKQAVEQRWASRLRARAVTCTRDFLPSWRDSDADIRTQLTKSDCLAEFDVGLGRWIGLQRVQSALKLPPLRSATKSPLQIVAHREFISSVVQARDAGVALFQGANGFAIVDLGTGRVLFDDATPNKFNSLLGLSPNGRVVAQRTQEGVVLRLAEGGARLVDIPLADGVVWLDGNTLIVRSNGSNGQGMNLLDLSSGDSAPLPGGASRTAYLSAPVPGVPNRFNLLSSSGVSQFDISLSDGRYEALLVNEGGAKASMGFAINTGGLSADGTKWVDGGTGVLRIMDMQTLEVSERSFEPVRSSIASPTADSDQTIVSLARAKGDGLHSIVEYHLYTHTSGTLAKIRKEHAGSDRYVFVNAIKRLAVIEKHILRFVDELSTEVVQPVDTVLNGFLDEINQRRLASAFGVPSDPLTQRFDGTQGKLDRGISPPPPALGQLLRDAQIEGVGVYEGSPVVQSPTKYRTPGTVEIRVRKSANPLGLVLVSYEPVRWKLTLEPGARLLAVMLGGYYPSAVEGAGSVRIYQIGQGYAYERQTAEFAKLQRTTVEWVGKPMSMFQGRYKGSTFMVGGQP